MKRNTICELFRERFQLTNLGTSTETER